MLSARRNITFIFFEKPLSIRSLQKGEYSKVPYDFLYQKDLEYIIEPERIVKLVMQRYYQNDFLFIKKLASYFSQVYGCKTTAPEVARLAEASLYAGTRNKGLEEIDQNGNQMVLRMLKLLILKHYEYSNGYIKYTNEVNYRNLHDLIAFINNYDKKYPIVKEDVSPNISTGDDVPAVTNDSSKSKKNNSSEKKPKVRRKTKYNLDGQMSFDV